VVNEYWVIPTGGSWVLRHEDAEFERFQDKMRAILRAEGLARANRPSEVIVLDRGGGVEDRRSFDELL
jgi:hypothetical protein